MPYEGPTPPLVDRLRAHANAPTRYEDVGAVEYDCLHAAAEIERLTAALTAAYAARDNGRRRD